MLSIMNDTNFYQTCPFSPIELSRAKGWLQREWENGQIALRRLPGPPPTCRSVTTWIRLDERITELSRLLSPRMNNGAASKFKRVSRVTTTLLSTEDIAASLRRSCR